MKEKPIPNYESYDFGRYNEYCFQNYRKSNFILFSHLFLVCLSSIFYSSILILTFTRFLAVFFPVFYRRIVEKRAIAYMIIIYDFAIFMFFIVICLFLTFKFTYLSEPFLEHFSFKKDDFSYLYVPLLRNYSSLLNNFSFVIDPTYFGFNLKFHLEPVLDIMVTDELIENSKQIPDDLYTYTIYNVYDYLTEEDVVVDRISIREILSLIVKLSNAIIISVSNIFAILFIVKVLFQIRTNIQLNQRSQLFDPLKIAIGIFLENIVAFAFNFVSIVELLLVFLDSSSQDLILNFIHGFLTDHINLLSFAHFWYESIDYWVQLGIFIDSIIVLFVFAGYRQAMVYFIRRIYALILTGYHKVFGSNKIFVFLYSIIFRQNSKSSVVSIKSNSVMLRDKLFNKR